MKVQCQKSIQAYRYSATVKSEELFLIINPSRFNHLKNILEGYDGLAILSSVDIKNGIVRLKYSEEVYSALIDLLASIAPEIRKQNL